MISLRKIGRKKTDHITEKNRPSPLSRGGLFISCKMKRKTLWNGEDDERPE